MSGEEIVQGPSLEKETWEEADNGEDLPHIRRVESMPPFAMDEQATVEPPELTPPDPYVVDEEHLQQLEAMMSDEERDEQREIAGKMKAEGNKKFGAGCFEDAVEIYTEALQTCPPSFTKDRSVLYGNRAACFIKLEQYAPATNDCDSCLKLDPNYSKVLYRRGWCYERNEETWDKAMTDYKAVLSLDPTNTKVTEHIHALEPRIAARNEKMKNEMIGKLKDLGNMVLGRWGMSVDNFKLDQNPDGGYSIKMQQN